MRETGIPGVRMFPEERHRMLNSDYGDFIVRPGRIYNGDATPDRILVVDGREGPDASGPVRDGPVQTHTLDVRGLDPEDTRWASEQANLEVFGTKSPPPYTADRELKARRTLAMMRRLEELREKRAMQGPYENAGGDGWSSGPGAPVQPGPGPGRPGWGGPPPGWGGWSDRAAAPGPVPPPPAPGPGGPVPWPHPADPPRSAPPDPVAIPVPSRVVRFQIGDSNSWYPTAYHDVILQDNPRTGEPFALYLVHDKRAPGPAPFLPSDLDAARIFVDGSDVAYDVVVTGMEFEVENRRVACLLIQGARRLEGA